LKVYTQIPLKCFSILGGIWDPMSLIPSAAYLYLS